MRSFKYKGKFNGDPETLPAHRIEEGEVRYKEIDDLGKLGREMNIVGLFMFAVLFINNIKARKPMVLTVG